MGAECRKDRYALTHILFAPTLYPLPRLKRYVTGAESDEGIPYSIRTREKRTPSRPRLSQLLKGPIMKGGIESSVIEPYLY